MFDAEKGEFMRRRSDCRRETTEQGKRRRKRKRTGRCSDWKGRQRNRVRGEGEGKELDAGVTGREEKENKNSLSQNELYACEEENDTGIDANRRGNDKI